MRVPLVDLKSLYARHREEILEAIHRVLDAQQFIMGPEVSQLEEELATYVGSGCHCVSVASGSAALILGLTALGIGEGDEVIVPAYTFIATANSVCAVGATPVFVDIEPDGYLLDLEQVAARIGPRTRAVIPVHLFGEVVRWDHLTDAVAGRADLVLLEDAAQAFGARFGDRKVGALGDAACLSFFPSKNLGGFGDGGAVVTPSKEVAEGVARRRVHGASAPYRHETLGFNLRLDALQAAVLRTRLHHLDEWVAARRRNAELYRARLTDADLAQHLRWPQEDSVGQASHTYNQFCVRVDGGRRDALQAHLRARGVGTAVYYPLPLPYQPCFRSLGCEPGDFPRAERASGESLALPVSPGLSEEGLSWVVDCIAEFFDQ